MVAKRNCPVCGEEMEDFPCEICENCFWEKDEYQEEFPDATGHANKMSLNQAREAYKKGLKVY